MLLGLRSHIYIKVTHIDMYKTILTFKYRKSTAFSGEEMKSKQRQTSQKHESS